VRLVFKTFVCLFCGLSILGSGCGKAPDQWEAKRPKVVPASGIVKYSGEPVAGATVVFSPVNAEGIAASAITDSAGHFELIAFPPNKGAVSGQYKVSVTKIEMPAVPKAAKGAEAGHDETPSGPPKYLIPEKFGDPETSGLSADIPPEGKKDFNITMN
jgi:hypothetical protein